MHNNITKSAGKKVLILSGSPRIGGNSDILCDRFMAGALEAGNDVEKISLRQKNVGFCIACYACKKTKRCFQKDDLNGILDKIIAADVIVMATPVYFYTMDAQMKALIDRTVARWLEIRDKEFYFIATAADNDNASLERTFDGFSCFLDCFENVEEKGRIYGAGVYLPGEVRNTEAFNQAYEMGKTV